MKLLHKLELLKLSLSTEYAKRNATCGYFLHHISVEIPPWWFYNFGL
jgi:hypothetical protein